MINHLRKYRILLEQRRHDAQTTFRATAIEYMLIAALISVAILGFSTAFESDMSTIFGEPMKFVD